MDKPKPPSEDDVRDAINDGGNLLQILLNYRVEASRIDGSIIDSTDHYVPLDSLPYGEELIRTQPLPNKVQDAISTLQMIENGFLSAELAAAAFEKSQEAIQSAQDTLDDCRSLPESDDDDDDGVVSENGI